MYGKVHFDPGVTQGRNSLGFEVCDVPFLLQLKPEYWRCVQSHVSRQQNCPTAVLWCNQAFIPHHIWNCTLLKELLLAELTEAPYLVLSFDKSFNPELQQEQMDFVVRYFAQGMVKTRYLTSAFLGHTRAEDLKLKFKEAVSDLNVKKLAQVSMDGPLVHGAFHSGMLKTSWGIDSVLKALHNLFSESPAKREDFIKLTRTETFPLPFCGHRWLENKQVAERALEIWPHITTYMREP